jgi:hypothetical protein
MIDGKVATGTLKTRLPSPRRRHSLQRPGISELLLGLHLACRALSTRNHARAVVATDSPLISTALRTPSFAGELTPECFHFRELLKMQLILTTNTTSRQVSIDSRCDLAHRNLLS